MITRIYKLKSDYEDFKSEWWKNCFVSFTMKTAVLKDEYDNDEEFEKEITLHISEVDFNVLNDKDLVRLFEYVIRQTVDCTNARVNNTELKEPLQIKSDEDNIIKYFTAVFGLKLNTLAVANWELLDEFCNHHGFTRDFVITTVNKFIKQQYNQSDCI